MNPCGTYSILSSPQIPYGIGTAAGIRVGNLLGAGEPGKAKKSAAVAVLFASEWFAYASIQYTV